MEIKTYDSKTGTVRSSDGSTAPAGFSRSKIVIPARKNIVLVGIVLAAFAVLVILTISYQLIFLSYSLLTIYIFMSYLILWMDGAWENKTPPKPAKWPDVALIIPSYNAGHTIFDAIKACKELHYEGKKEIIVVDDGSTDGSFEKLKHEPGIKLLRKEKNSGKAAAMNYGIMHTDSEIIGCVDSDTYPQKHALERAVRYFYTEDRVGSVVLFICVHAPKTLLEKMQEIEYRVSFGFFFKTVASIGGLYVTPGPMALYKKEVFETLGHFDEKNLTEDMEIALRMQRHGWKIKACHEAIAFTEVPTSLWRLYKQRLRWFRGGIMNLLKYSDMLFNPKYGNFGLFVLPTTLGSGFFAAMFVLWTLMQHARTIIAWATPWFVNPAAFAIDTSGFVVTNWYIFDSAMVFGFINLFIWIYFVYASFRLSEDKFKLKHALPMAMMIWFYPMFIGFTFLSSYILEFSGRKYKW